MAERNVPGQLGLFKPTKTPDEPSGAAGATAVWVYPCALCEAAEVDQAGGTVRQLRTDPTPRPTRRRATKKTTDEEDDDQADRHGEGHGANGCAGAALMASRGMDPRIRTEAFRIGFATVLAAWLIKHLAGGVWWLVRQPVLWALAASGYVGWRLWDGSGPTALVVVTVALVVVLAAWRLLHAGSFRAWVWWPVRAWWRRMFVYAPEWEPLMTALHLTTKKAGEDERLVPQLLRVRSTGAVDKLRVRMQAGQVLSDFAKNADRLAATFQASTAGSVRSRARSRRRNSCSG